MADLTPAVEVAAKAALAQSIKTHESQGEIYRWKSLSPSWHVLPIITALDEAGLLKDTK